MRSARAVVVFAVGTVVASCAGGSDPAPTGQQSVALSSTTLVTDSVTPPEPSAPSTAVLDTKVVDVTVPIEPVPLEVAGAPAGVKGTFDAPVPSGQIADLGRGWRLQVLEVVPDWKDPSFYLESIPGKVFTRVRVVVGYFGVDDPVGELFVQAMGPDNAEIFELAGGTEHILFSGGVLARDLVFEVSAADPTAFVLYVDEQVYGETVVLDVAPTTAAPMQGLIGPQSGARSTELRAATPLSIGTTADIGEGWAVTVTGAARDVTDEVLASGSSVSEVPAGYRYVGVGVSFAYSGSEPANSYAVAFTALKALPSGSNLAYPSATCNLVDSQDFAGNPIEVPSGGTVSGTMCFAVPDIGDVTDMQLVGGWFVAFFPYPGEPAPLMAFLAVR
jgi:hypothetical protein